jgi:hypothetical protein
MLIVERHRQNRRTPMLSELDVLKDVTGRLGDAGIAYMLTGSVAMNYYAQPRMTRDIDLVVALDPGDVARLRELFGGDYYLPEADLERALATAGMFNIVHLESVIKVDFIVRKREPYRETEFSRRALVDLPGFQIWIASREDLILSKLVWAKDSRSELQLRDVKNLLAADVDQQYLRAWASRLEVGDLLEESFNG